MQATLPMAFVLEQEGTFKQERIMNCPKNLLTTLLPLFAFLPFFSGAQSQCDSLSTLEPCLVTVDSMNNNVVVWEKENNTNEAPVDSFIIYRNINGTFERVASVDGDSLSRWVDTDPDVKPVQTHYQYKVAKKDTCGNVGPLGKRHRTIHLTVNLDVNNCPFLEWSGYIGFNPVKGHVLRDTVGDGEYTVIDTINPPSASYTDTEICGALPDSLGYRVEAIPQDPCQATRSEDYNSSRSNRGTIQGPAGMWGPDPEPDPLEVRRIHGKQGGFEIQIPDQRKAYRYQVFDITGQKVHTGKIPRSSGVTHGLDLSANDAGIYFLSLRSQEARWTSKLLRR